MAPLVPPELPESPRSESATIKSGARTEGFSRRRDEMDPVAGMDMQVGYPFGCLVI
jgi:hypothetical protein